MTYFWRIVNEEITEQIIHDANIGLLVRTFRVLANKQSVPEF